MRDYDDYYAKFRRDEYRRREWSKLIFNIGFIVVMLGAVVFSCARGNFVSDSDAIRSAQAAGYSDVKVVSKDFLTPGWSGCSEHDAVTFKARAKNAAGAPVTILICMGWPLKGATIRIP